MVKYDLVTPTSFCGYMGLEFSFVNRDAGFYVKLGLYDGLQWDYGRIGNRLFMGLTDENECKWMFEGYMIPVFFNVFMGLDTSPEMLVLKLQLHKSTQFTITLYEAGVCWLCLALACFGALGLCKSSSMYKLSV